MPTINLWRKRNRGATTNSKAYAKIYSGKKWRNLRQWKLSENPLCEICESKGLTVVAVEVHHIVHLDPLNPNPLIVYDCDNLQSICVFHHRAIHS